jgi:hypothetical protein
MCQAKLEASKDDLKKAKSEAKVRRWFNVSPL